MALFLMSMIFLILYVISACELFFMRKMLCGCDQQAANRAMSPSCGDWPESCFDTGSKNTVTKNTSCSFCGNIIMQEFILFLFVILYVLEKKHRSAPLLFY